MIFIYSKLLYTLLDVIRIYLKNNYIQKKVNWDFSYPNRILVGIRDFMQYRENPDQIGMGGQSSLC